MDTNQVPPHEIVVSSDPKEVQQCYDIRVAVFHVEQGFSLEAELDEYEDISAHILLRLTPSLLPIGTIRAYKFPGREYYKLSRLAILSEYRKYRLGRELVLALHEWVKADAIRSGMTGTVEIHSHSQIYVKGFYAKLGYEPEGEEFDEDGDPHQNMVLRMPL